MQVEGLELDILKEIALIREPLLPILQNLKAMRAVVQCIDSMDFEAGRLAGEVLAGTSGGRELPELQLSSSEFLGVKLPFCSDPVGSCGGWPPATDDARPGQLYHEDLTETGPEAKPKLKHQESPTMDLPVAITIATPTEIHARKLRGPKRRNILTSDKQISAWKR